MKLREAIKTLNEEYSRTTPDYNCLVENDFLSIALVLEKRFGIKTDTYELGQLYDNGGLITIPMGKN